MQFFTKNAVTYTEFRQQCQSLRIFAFAAVTGGCCLCLALDPPRSSYWLRYSPAYWFSSLRQIFITEGPPIFLTQKIEHEADVPYIVNELIAKRRIVSGG